MPAVAVASRQIQTVSWLAALLAEPDTAADPWARPWVTFWKSNLTSPSEAEIRVTPGLVEAPPAVRCSDAAPGLMRSAWPSGWISCPLAAWSGGASTVFGTGIRSIDEARGLRCSIELKVPDPLKDNPGLPYAKAVATWPGITCATWPDLKSATSTCPLNTSTLVEAAFTETRNCVPLTTAARKGVSTSKCLTFCFSTSRRIDPACCTIVVASPSFFSAGKPITEFGETRIVSSPRTRRTRPLWPVRTVSPGFKISSCLSETGCAPVVVIQTSPDDLLTDQTPSSPANAWDAAPRTHAVVRMRQKPPARVMEISVCLSQPAGLPEMFQDRISACRQLDGPS